ncbi:hypothetical protein BV898_14737 [Hypsibius exemplaris]|uniref:Cadherin domain-containing protein n=1 Tax=Hypsibius exemplaris TaxID=2072580 RepID=A0A9X6RJS2_HYPEX|nr:hypothetical protein BV898_14737 [Hypsibius exemplaris]
MLHCYCRHIYYGRCCPTALLGARQLFIADVRATEGCSRSGTGTAIIELQGDNDSPPKFQRKNYTQSIDETPGRILKDVAVGEKLVHLTSTDADNDGKSKIYYCIKRSTDPGRQFTLGVPG